MRVGGTSVAPVLDVLDRLGQALSAAGHRSAGNRGANPFTIDCVRIIQQNWFDLGHRTGMARP